MIFTWRVHCDCWEMFLLVIAIPYCVVMTTYNENTAPSEEANSDVNRQTQVEKDRKPNHIHCISERKSVIFLNRYKIYSTRYQ